MQLERDITHGTHVDADVFAGGAIAARGTAHQHAVLIQQADRQAIELRLAAVLHRRATTEQIANRKIQTFGHSPVELAHVGFFEGVAEAEHRHFMAHLGERRQCRAAHPLGRRITGHQFRVGGFKGFEFVEQPVVFDVRNARLVQHVIAIVVLIQLGTQL
ncbi:hypothetical protein D3C87_1694990 [compost metagenome]